MRPQLAGETGARSVDFEAEAEAADVSLVGEGGGLSAACPGGPRAAVESLWTRMIEPCWGILIRRIYGAWTSLFEVREGRQGTDATLGRVSCEQRQQ